jgi:ribonuclease P protein component
VSAVAPKKDSNAARNAGKFPRSARLLRHADFERVYKQGRRHFSASITVFYLERREVQTEAKSSKPPGISGIRVGFTVGRSLGGAVERNRMKRRLREIVRQTRPSGGRNVDVVMNPKKSLMAADFSAVLNEVTRAFEVIEQKTARKPGIKPSSESEAK